MLLSFGNVSYAGTLYYYDKYEAITKWTMPNATTVNQSTSSWMTPCYTSFTWSAGEKRFYSSGAIANLSANGSICNYVNADGSQLVRYQRSSTGNGVITYTNWYAAYAVANGKMMGALVESNIVAEAGVYPEYGLSGSYYYQRKGLVGDTEKPTINLTQSPNGNQDVKITINTSDNVGVTQVKWAEGDRDADYFSTNGTIVSASGSFIVTNDMTYTVWATDSAGNQNISKISITIDREAPEKPIIVANNTELTNNDVKLSISYPSDAIRKEVKISSDGIWIEYITPIVLSSNDTVYARSIDSSDNISEESVIQINNIDKILPTKPKASVSENQLSITPGTDASGIKSTQYQINNGLWIEYTNVVTLENGDLVINMKSTDNAGNHSGIESISVSVSSISLSQAIEAVESAEVNPTQSKVDVAQDLLNKIPSSNEKEELQKRLDDVQKAIDSYSNIQNEINVINVALNGGSANLEDVSQYKDRIEDVLREMVNELPDTMNIGYLNDQLDDLYNKLLLIESVIKSNSDGNVEGINLGDLQNQVDELPKGELKDQLQEQLDQAKLQDAINKVESAESSKTQLDVDLAREALNKLTDGQVKKELTDRLNAVQDQINSGGGGNQPVTDIDLIEDTVVKATLLDVERYVELAEKYKSKTWIVNALDKVEAIPSSIKLNPMYTSIVQDLTNRANKLKDDYNGGIADQEAQQKVTIATNYVTMYEKYKTSYYKTKAQSSVDALSNSEVKTTLLARINAVK